MVSSAPLVITPEVRATLRRLRDFAGSRPTDMAAVMDLQKSDEGKRQHWKDMHARTVTIPGPWPFEVTFSIEANHPGGTMRHMSMSIRREGRVPHPAGLWMVAEELGFAGGLEACRIWPEELSDGGTAINLAQPISVTPETVQRDSAS